MAAALRLELVVVRHGLTQWNRERRYQGQRDIPLLLPEALPDMDRLRDHLAGEAFDAVYCSDLTRCRQTLVHLLAGGDASGALPTDPGALAHLLEGRTERPRFDPRLRELDFGDYEGHTWEELQADARYRAWVDSAGRLATPGGESADDLWARLSAWLEALLAEARERRHRRVLAVSHGGAIRELRHRLEATPFWEGVVGQAQGRRFVFDHQEGGWRCSASSAVPVPVAGR